MALLLFVFGPSILAFSAEETQKLFGDPIDATDNGFGRIVSIDGSTIAVSAKGEGAVYTFYRHESGTWTWGGAKRPSNGHERDFFGDDLDVDGSYLIVGAPRDDDRGLSTGAAYIFVRRADGAWVQQAKLHASDPQSYSNFGAAVALDGDTAIVGASRHSVGAEQRGAAYVFVRDAQGNWQEQDRLLPPEVLEEQRFGGDVDVDGDTVLINCPGRGPHNRRIGRAYVFGRQSSGEWIEQAELIVPTAVAKDWTGGPVELDGNTALVGTTIYIPYGPDNPLGWGSGEAHAFVREPSGQWSYSNALRAADGALRSFGGSMALSGDVAVFAIERDNRGEGGEVVTGDLNEWSESAYVFTRNADQTWTERLKMLFNEDSEDSWEGSSVGLLGDELLVGRAGDSTLARNSGAVYVYRLRAEPSDAAGMLDRLIESVESLGLLYGIERSLVAKLQTCRRMLDRENQQPARVLMAFVHHVEAQQGRHIDEEDAQALIAAAYEIIDLLDGTDLQGRGRTIRFNRARIGPERQVGTIVPSRAGP